MNVLLEMGVPVDRADEVLDFVVQGAESVGVLREIKGKKYVDLSGVSLAAPAEVREAAEDRDTALDDPPPDPPALPAPAAASAGPQARRVFITHGKNKALIDPIKKLLGAAIIHVDAEQKLIDREAAEHVVLNPNVLIEIGAAMALFGRRVVLLVREGVKLPSNLQGLFEVRYAGETLDGDATIKLLEAINDIKNHPLPDRHGGLGA